VLVGAGDIATCAARDDEATAALVETIPGFVFTLGDNAYESGTAAQFRDCYDPSWGRFLDRTRFAVIGNHDDLTDDGAPAKAYFGSAATRDGVTWFSEDVGTWHVIVLDSNCEQLKGGCGAGSAQLEWLRADLAASSARCTLALWHQPRFSSGFHGNDPSVAPFWDALYAAGADLVLNGHDHDYERFAPQDPAGRGDPARGITEIVVGTGGAGLRPFGTIVPNGVVRSSLAHGVLVLTLKSAGWSYRFVSTDGSFSDAGQGSCH
jgi:alkaline phosphatase